MCAYVPYFLSCCFPGLKIYNTIEQDRRLGEVDGLFLPLLFTLFSQPRVGYWAVLYYWRMNTVSIPHAIQNKQVEERKGSTEQAKQTKEEQIHRTRRRRWCYICSRNNQVKLMRTLSCRLNVRHKHTYIHIQPATDMTHVHHVIVGLAQARPDNTRQMIIIVGASLTYW
jgi:hypothetical protein